MSNEQIRVHLQKNLIKNLIFKTNIKQSHKKTEKDQISLVWL